MKMFSPEKVMLVLLLAIPAGWAGIVGKKVR